MKVRLRDLNLEKEEDRIEADKCLEIMKLIMNKENEIKFVSALTSSSNAVSMYFMRFNQIMLDPAMIDRYGTRTSNLYFFANLDLISRVAQHAYKLIGLTKGETKDRMRQFGYLLMAIKTKFIIRRVRSGWRTRAIRKYRDLLPLTENQLYYRKKVKEIGERDGHHI